MRSFSLLAGLAAVSLATVAPPGRAPTGTIGGTVTYTGTPPKMRPIDMAKEPACQAAHATPAMTENVVTGPGNTLRWVVVYVSAGDQGSAAPTEAGLRTQARSNRNFMSIPPFCELRSAVTPIPRTGMPRGGSHLTARVGSRQWTARGEATTS